MTLSLCYRVDKISSSESFYGSLYAINSPKKSSDSAEVSCLISCELGELSSYLKANYPKNSVDILISGEFITYKCVPITIKNKRQMLQAIPYLVEEQIISNIDDMQIVASDIWNNNQIRIALLERSFFDNLKHILSLNQLPVSGIYGLPDILSHDNNELVIAIFEKYSIIKSKNVCLQCENENILDIVSLFELDELDKVSIYQASGVGISSSVASSLKKILPINQDLKIESMIIDTDMLEFVLSSRYSGADKINILKSDDSSSDKFSLALKIVKPALISVYLFAIIQIFLNFASGYYFEYRTKKAFDEANKHYLAKFPTESHVVDVKSQIYGKLKSVQLSGNPGSFSKIFGVTSEAILKLRSSSNNVSVKLIRYDELSSELKVDLEVNALSDIDGLKKTINESGLHAEIVSANQVNQVVKASILVKVI